MRLTHFALFALAVAALTPRARAQSETEPPAEEQSPPDEGGETGEGDVELRAPTLEPPSLGVLAPAAEEPSAAPGEDQPEASAEPTPSSSAPSADPTQTDWTVPRTVLTLRGYFRVRGEWQDTFWLGRQPLPGSTVDAPFSAFKPADAATIPAGGCGETSDTSGASSSACDTTAMSFANMRLRLEPTVSLSEDVQLHMMIDAFDNLVLGSTPDGNVYDVPAGSDGFTRADRTPGVPIDSFSSTSHPPSAFRNSLSDSIAVRRVWASVRNRELGEIRFGRMGSMWGLGILANDGAGIDADFSSDVDRLLGVTKIAGFYLIAAYDFANEGFTQQSVTDLPALAYDAAQEDDVDQYVLAVARRLAPEEQLAQLERGEPVLNGGVYFVYRSQLLSSQGAADPFAAPGAISSALVRRNAEAFIPDLWIQFLYRQLRLELEAVGIGGSIENIETTSFEATDLKVQMYGAAFEAEYRLLADRLGLHFNTGYASGDASIEGLTSQSGLLAQLDGDDTVSTFRFHPAYRVDLILWRNIMRQVAGAYYFRPGISYDFDRTAAGRLFGLRVDGIWSRASQPVQTWGNDSDLGVELDGSIYYRSEDGPAEDDGFYASLQYGVLFPMAGLGYLEDSDGRGQFADGTNPELKTAQTIRFVLGVQY